MTLNKQLFEAIKYSEIKTTMRHGFSNSPTMSADTKEFLKKFNKQNGTNMTWFGNLVVTEEDYKKLGGTPKAWVKAINKADNQNYKTAVVAKWTAADGVFYDIDIY